MAMDRSLVLTADDSAWIDEISQSLANGDKVTVSIETPAMSPAEFAKYMGVSRPAVQKWIAKGKVRSFMRGTYHRIPMDEVERFKAQYCGV